MWKSDREKETGRYGVAVSLSTCSALTLPLLQHFALAPRAFSDFFYIFLRLVSISYYSGQIYFDFFNVLYKDMKRYHMKWFKKIG